VQAPRTNRNVSIATEEKEQNSDYKYNKDKRAKSWIHYYHQNIQMTAEIRAITRRTTPKDGFPFSSIGSSELA